MGKGLPRWLSGKESACQCKRGRRCRLNPLVGKILLEEEMATHSSILAWKIPWIEERDRLQPTVHGVEKSRTRLSDFTFTFLLLQSTGCGHMGSSCGAQA